MADQQRPFPMIRLQGETTPLPEFIVSAQDVRDLIDKHVDDARRALPVWGQAIERFSALKNGGNLTDLRQAVIAALAHEGWLAMAFGAREDLAEEILAAVHAGDDTCKAVQSAFIIEPEGRSWGYALASTTKTIDGECRARAEKKYRELFAQFDLAE